MTIPTGVDMQLKYKVQSALGTMATGGSGQQLRRVQSTLNLQKDTYQSNEIRADRQVADFRHGVRRVTGAITGELSAGTYEDFMAAVFRRDFTAVSAITGAALTISGSGPTYVVQRGSGSYISDGVKLGHVIRLSVGSLDAANLSKNLLVVALDADEATVVPLNGVALVAEGPISGCTVTVVGKVTYCPESSHTEKYYSIEHWYPTFSTDVSETFWDCVVDTLGIELPPTGIATLNFGIMGLDLTTAATENLTSATAVTTSGVLAAVNGVLRTSSGAMASVTGLSINVTNNCQMAGPVVGSNKGVDIVKGRHQVSGQITALFDSVTMRDAFIDESELSLYAAFTASNAAAADFVAFTIDRLKLGGADRDDGEGVKIVTLPFTALFNSSGGSSTTSDKTTMRVQDSLA